MAERIDTPAHPQQQGEIPKPHRGDTARPKAERPAPQAGDPASARPASAVITDWASI